MGRIRDLKNINKYIEDEEERFQKRKQRAQDGDAGRVRYLKLKDKEAVKVIFLQELSADSPNYSQKNDLGVLAVEHVNPSDYRRHAECTIDDEGACFGCEQHKADYKAGWRQKNKLYINVLVDDGTEEPYVAILSQGNGPKSVTPALIEQASEFPSITDTWYKIKRNGAELSNTSYVLTRLGEHDKNVEDYEVNNLEERVIRQVPYSQQEAYYFDGVDRPEPAVAEVPDSQKVPW